MASVRATKSGLAAEAHKKADKFGVAGIGPKESEKNVRHFTEEQLRASESIIGLQSGSNKGATQSGINFGNTRHM